MFFINGTQVNIGDLLQWPSKETYKVLDIKESVGEGVKLSLKHMSTNEVFKDLYYPKNWITNGVKFVSPNYKQDSVLAKIKYLDERYKTQQLRKRANESSSIRLGDNNLQQGESVRYIQSSMYARNEEGLTDLDYDMLEYMLEYASQYANRRG